MSALAYLIILPKRLFPLLLGALVALRLLNGQIITRGLLVDPETRGTSALRVQMFVATLIAATSYVAKITQAPTLTLPALDPHLLALVTGSNGLLLGGRVFEKLLTYLKPTN